MKKIRPQLKPDNAYSGRKLCENPIHRVRDEFSEISGIEIHKNVTKYFCCSSIVSKFCDHYLKN